MGIQSTFQVYDDYFHSGFAERVAQEINLFNGASAGAITLADEFIMGQFGHESFHKLAGQAAERDPTTDGTTTDSDMTMDELVSVKLARRYGPFKKTVDSWRQMGSSPEEMSYLLGVGAAEAMLEEMLNTGIAAVVAALKNQATNYLDLTADASPNISHSNLNRMRAKLGDKSGRIAAYVQHGVTYHELVGDAIAGAITNVADVAIVAGSTATLGRPTIMSDIPGIYQANVDPTKDIYTVLALLPGAVQCIRSEAGTIDFGPVRGATPTDNISYRFTYEYAYNLKLRGFKYSTGAGAYPNLATLATGTNWTKAVTSHKDLAGVVMDVNGYESTG